MNIGIFSDCYLPTKNGVTTSILQLSEGLERRGHSVIIVTAAYPGYDEAEADVYRFPSLPFNRSIETRLGIVRQGWVQQIVRDQKLDLIHTHTEFSLGRSGKRAAQKFGLPLTHTAHTHYEAYLHYLPLGTMIPPRAVRWFWKQFLSNYDILVCPAPHAQDYFQTLNLEVDSIVIANGAERALFCPQNSNDSDKRRLCCCFGIRPTDKVILNVGRLAPEKRTWALLEALLPLLREHPDTKLLLVGSGPWHRRLAEAVAEQNVREQIILAGYREWSEMPAIYALADVFVTASLSEVHPLTLIEAAMSGLPIAARRHGSTTDLVEHEINGYLADTDVELADFTRHLLGNVGLRASFSKNSLTLSKQFRIEAHIDVMEALYGRMIQGKKGNSSID